MAKSKPIKDKTLEIVEDLEPETLESTEGEEPEMMAEEAEVEVEAEAVAEKKPRKRRSKTPTPDVLFDTTQKSLEQMTKQWEAIQGITVSIAQNLERVNALMKEIPVQQAIEQKNEKMNSPQRWAFGISLVAILMSVLGLSLAHSARQEIFSKEFTYLKPRDPGYSAPAQVSQAPVEKAIAKASSNTRAKKNKKLN